MTSAATSANLAGRIEADTFIYPVRIFYEDTDAGGLVYHSLYLNYAERARTEFLRALGIQQSRLLAETGLAFAVRDCQIEFLRPGGLDDLIEVRSRVLDIAGAAIRMEQRIWRDDEPLVNLTVRVAAVRTATGRPTRIPALVHQAMAPFMIDTKQG